MEGQEVEKGMARHEREGSRQSLGPCYPGKDVGI